MILRSAIQSQEEEWMKEGRKTKEGIKTWHRSSFGSDPHSWHHKIVLSSSFPTFYSFPTIYRESISPLLYPSLLLFLDIYPLKKVRRRETFCHVSDLSHDWTTLFFLLSFVSFTLHLEEEERRRRGGEGNVLWRVSIFSFPCLQLEEEKLLSILKSCYVIHPLGRMT